MPKVAQRKTAPTKIKKTRPKLPTEGHRFEINHNHGLAASIREEEQRVATTCFACHGPKPFGGNWLCPKCTKIDRVGSAKADIIHGRNR